MTLGERSPTATTHLRNRRNGSKCLASASMLTDACSPHPATALITFYIQEDISAMTPEDGHDEAPTGHRILWFAPDRPVDGGTIFVRNGENEVDQPAHEVGTAGSGGD